MTGKKRRKASKTKSVARTISRTAKMEKGKGRGCLFWCIVTFLIIIALAAIGWLLP